MVPFFSAVMVMIALFFNRNKQWHAADNGCGLEAIESKENTLLPFFVNDVT